MSLRMAATANASEMSQSLYDGFNARTATANSTEIKPEAYTKPFCDFLKESPTIFHAVDYFKSKARASGFEEVRVDSGRFGHLTKRGLC